MIEMRQTGGRHELKHYINQGDLIQLRSRLPIIMAIDKNADEKGGYRIRSLYFDNYNDKALKEKIDGVDNREKFRLRFYNDNSEFMRLEKKSKKNGICFKRNSRISQRSVEAILAGNYETLKESNDPLQIELYTKMKYQNLRPKNIVDYRREAFVYKAGNVRVTLDYELRASSGVREFLKPKFISIPLPEMYILEIKYDNFLPEIIRGLTTLSSRRATALSKYAVTRII